MLLKRWQTSSGIRAPRVAQPGRKHLATTALQQRDLTANIVETVATLALKTRLKSGEVQTRVDCDALGLMAGRMRGVEVQGRQWQSPVGLTAQNLKFMVGEAAVDYPALLIQRKIVLANKPTGRACITFTATDFGNFLLHPLMQTAAARAVQGQAFYFDRETVSIQSTGNGAQYAAHFSGIWSGNGLRYHMMLQPSAISSNGSGSRVTVLPDAMASQPSDAAAVAAHLSSFFSNLMVDLQGVQLRYKALVFVPAAAARGGGGQMLLQLNLDLCVESFPPLDIRF